MPLLFVAGVLGSLFLFAALRAPSGSARSFADATLPLGGPEGYSIDDFIDLPPDLDGRPEEEIAPPAEGADDPVPALEPEEGQSPQPVPSRVRVRYTNYTVKRGDTLDAIARQFGLDWYTLLTVNGIRDPRRLTPGATLRIPDRKGVLYVVQRHDTLEDIALRYRVPIKTIQETNGIENPNRIWVGQELFLPNAQIPRVLPGSSAQPERFIRPVSGRVSSPFGMRTHPISGRRTMHQGIDFASGAGARVVAARSGRVIYAGRLGGYGNLVVIDHGGGVTTRYAHLQRIVVRRGQRVRQGATLGYTGSTGYSTGPHLHFEIRINDRAVDPARYLR
ncbi:MAG: hypothetical protein KatS3mg115_1680 [Candidatus Poribacteria bacterium]|nr:MAG: hypothetical protein KatS3mg115_1680 [Candidatus Poribacteria bacterium]